MCIDGAPVNVKMHQLIQTELGEHCLLNRHPAHKIELAIKDTFEQSDLNNNLIRITSMFTTCLKKPTYVGGCSNTRPIFRVLNI